MANLRVQLSNSCTLALTNAEQQTRFSLAPVECARNKILKLTAVLHDMFAQVARQKAVLRVKELAKLQAGKK